MSKFLISFLLPLSALAQNGVDIPFFFQSTPTASTATLVLWVKSDSYVSNGAGPSYPPADGGACGGWGDLSGSGHHLQMGLTAGPTTHNATYHASGGGGNNSPYLQFSSSWFTNEMASFSYAQTNTLIAAIKDHQALTTAWTIDAGPNEMWYNSYGAPLLYHVNAGTDFNPASPNPFMSGNAWHVVTIQFAGNNSFVRVDGTNVANWTGAAGSGSATRFDVGSAYNGTSPGLIDLMEIRFYNGFFNTTSIHPIEQTIGTSWGITVN